MILRDRWMLGGWRIIFPTSVLLCSTAGPANELNRVPISKGATCSFVGAVMALNMLPSRATTT